MWFVDQILPGPSGTIFGIAELTGSHSSIGNAVFSFKGGLGRLDTIAHEIGHNLGLDHDTFGAGVNNRNNLMTAGSTRNIPGSINDINPTGAGLDQLTMAQINQARSSQFAQAVPTPSLLVGLVGVGVATWRKRRQPEKEAA